MLDENKVSSVNGNFQAFGKNLLVTLSVVATTVTAATSVRALDSPVLAPALANSQAVAPAKILESEAIASGYKDPVITNKVFIDIKIANYTEESTGTNKGADGSGQMVLGLYGNDAPESVKRFLATVDGNGMDTPSFVNSQFTRIAEGVLLEMERVRGINKVNIAGTDQYEYSGNILVDYKPILESNNLRHTRKGFLTRKQLTDGPEFGITLDTAENLDGFHVIFGCVISGLEVLDAIAEQPTYSYKTTGGYSGQKKLDKYSNDLADKWFEGQKNFYVGAGKAFGDTRAIDQRGRLLRRITVKKVGRA